LVVVRHDSVVERNSGEVEGLESLEVLRPPALTTGISHRLLEFLLAGNIEPGEKLPSERRLAEILGVGRSVVREAIKPLALLGIVEVRQGDGTYVKSVESNLLPEVIGWGLLLGTKRTLDLVEARRHIEVILARLAAERREDGDLEILRTALQEMHEAEDPDDYVAADIAFHLAVARAAKNDTLYEVLSSVRSLLQVWIAKVGISAGLSVAAAEHDPIFDAIANNDTQAAARTMDAHMAWAVEHLDRILDEDRG
jgi:GntR family transcriptional regulator, transcriptional repressor for pyruvate dehydrogenase complex